jgi:hypothetical protein
MNAGRQVGLVRGLVDNLRVGPGVVFDAAAHDAGHRRHGLGPAVGQGVAVGQVNPAVFRVFGIDGDIQKPSLALCEHLRRIADGFGKQSAISDLPKSPGAFSDQRGRIIKEDKPPWDFKTFDPFLDFQRVIEGLCGFRDGGLLSARSFFGVEDKIGQFADLTA